MKLWMQDTEKAYSLDITFFICLSPEAACTTRQHRPQGLPDYAECEWTSSTFAMRTTILVLIAGGISRQN